MQAFRSRASIIIKEMTLNRRTGSGSDLADSTDSTGVSGLINLEPC
jgi:hypothetical protein